MLLLWMMGQWIILFFLLFCTLQSFVIFYYVYDQKNTRSFIFKKCNNSSFQIKYRFRIIKNKLYKIIHIPNFVRVCLKSHFLPAWVTRPLRGLLPADVVNGDVSELFIHGGLALLSRHDTQGRLGMLVGYTDFYIVASN